MERDIFLAKQLLTATIRSMGALFEEHEDEKEKSTSELDGLINEVAKVIGLSQVQHTQWLLDKLEECILKA